MGVVREMSDNCHNKYSNFEKLKAKSLDFYNYYIDTT